MKKYYLLITLIPCLFFTVNLFAQQRCASHEVLKMQMAANPEFARKVKESEKNYADFMRQQGAQRGKPSSFTIPLVVHVVYNTAEENISDAQIQSQIDVLNEDFTATNPDYNNFDAGYGDVFGDADIKFCLDQVVRKQTTKRFFGFNDGVKKSRQGGSEAIDPMHRLNVWVCNLQNLLGYAQFPGGPAETFGIVCHYRAFGRGDQYDLFTAYNKGRTATHEVGHCIALRHIWGDANCGNDLVDDTPLHNEANFGCPGEGHLSTCTGNPPEMWMNFMDYTDDACMYMFSDGQVARGNFFIENDAQLVSIVNSSCSGGPGKNNITKSTGSAVNSSARISAPGFVVYPTISSGPVTFAINNAIAGNAEINIYNAFGELVLNKKIYVTEGSSTGTMDVSKLTNGFYFVQLNKGLERSTGKIIIQH